MEQTIRERIVLDGTLDTFRKFRNTEYKAGRLCNSRFNQASFNSWLKLAENKDFYYAYCLLESRRRKKERVSSKIFNLIENGEGLFVTLTFTDKVFEKTTRQTRRRYVSRYLKKFSKFYVANIDFGKDNGREHYHAVVDQKMNLNEWHKYGAIKVRKINAQEDQTVILSKYLTKLTNHAVKNTTGTERIIYSKNVF